MESEEQRYCDLKNFLCGISAQLRAHAGKFGDQPELSFRLLGLAREIELIDVGPDRYTASYRREFDCEELELS